MENPDYKANRLELAELTIDALDLLKMRMMGLAKEFSDKCTIATPTPAELTEMNELIIEAVGEAFHRTRKECKRIIDNTDDGYRSSVEADYRAMTRVGGSV